jgi:hypothetical protein
MLDLLSKEIVCYLIDRYRKQFATLPDFVIDLNWQLYQIDDKLFCPESWRIYSKIAFSLSSFLNLTPKELADELSENFPTLISRHGYLIFQFDELSKDCFLDTLDKPTTELDSKVLSIVFLTSPISSNIITTADFSLLSYSFVHNFFLRDKSYNTYVFFSNSERILKIDYIKLFSEFVNSEISYEWFVSQAEEVDLNPYDSLYIWSYGDKISSSLLGLDKPITSNYVNKSKVNLPLLTFKELRLLGENGIDYIASAIYMLNHYQSSELSLYCCSLSDNTNIFYLLKNIKNRIEALKLNFIDITYQDGLSYSEVSNDPFLRCLTFINYSFKLSFSSAQKSGNFASFIKLTFFYLNNTNILLNRYILSENQDFRQIAERLIYLTESNIDYLTKLTLRKNV